MAKLGLNKCRRGIIFSGTGSGKNPASTNPVFHVRRFHGLGPGNEKILGIKFIVLGYLSEYRIFGQVPVDKIHRHQVSEDRIFEASAGR